MKQRGDSDLSKPEYVIMPKKLIKEICDMLEKNIAKIDSILGDSS